MKIERKELQPIVKAAIKEDMGRGDITTNNIISPDRKAAGVIFSNEDCVLCGLEAARTVFKILDKDIRIIELKKDGDPINASTEVMRMIGRARTILTGERLALNFLSFMSGISTATRAYAEKIKEYDVKLLDTRKTIPLTRSLQKYAVRTGGGCNHRMNLGDMVLIKDNHIQISGGDINIADMRKNLGPDVSVEIEVDNLLDFKEALRQAPDVIMLDNMSCAEIRKAVAIRNSASRGKRVKLEASGGITLKNIRKYARTKVDSISVGVLTDSVRAIDYSLEIR